jgi:hypothetical protein
MGIERNEKGEKGENRMKATGRKLRKSFQVSFHLYERGSMGFLEDSTDLKVN